MSFVYEIGDQERERALRKCGLAKCATCSGWFWPEGGEFRCQECEPWQTTPCALCRRVHVRRAVSCFQSERERLGEAHGGAA